MGRRAPSSTRTDTLCPYTTLFRSGRLDVAGQLRQGQDLDRAARTLALRAGAAVHHRGDGAAPGDRRRIRWRAEVQARQAGRHVRALARREGKRMTGPATMLQLENITVDFAGLKAIDDLSLASPRGSSKGGIGPHGEGRTETG